MDSYYPFVQEQIKRLVDWSRTPQSPIHVEIYPTNRCNLGCLFCPNDTSSVTDEGLIAGELSDDRWLQIVAEGLEMGVLTWRIVGGGEPLIRADLVMSMVEMIKGYSPQTVCELHTNGSRFTEDSIRRLVSAGVDLVTLSVHGANEHTHDHLRTSPGSFQKIVEALRCFRDLKSRTGEMRPSLQFNTVLCHQNIRELGEIIQFASKFNVDRIDVKCVEPLVQSESVFKSLRVREEDLDWLERTAEGIVQAAASEGIILITDIPHVSPLLRNPRDNYRSLPEFSAIQSRSRKVWPRCIEPWYRVSITAEGKLHPCPSAVDGQEDFPESPHLSETSLAEAWQSAYMDLIRAKLYANEHIPICRNCFFQGDIQILNGVVGILDARCGGFWEPRGRNNLKIIERGGNRC